MVIRIPTLILKLALNLFRRPHPKPEKSAVQEFIEREERRRKNVEEKAGERGVDDRTA